MQTLQHFQAKLSWNKKKDSEHTTVKTYTKSHSIHIEGKEDLLISAAKIFKGDPNLHNPEDLLLSSLMSCHMMSYLFLCSKQQIEILSYQDEAVATLETYADGSGKIIEVVLQPKVELKNKNLYSIALSLHQEANKLCFIANSCNFPVIHKATTY